MTMRLRRWTMLAAWYVLATLLVACWLLGRGVELVAQLLDLVVEYGVRPIGRGVQDCLDWVEARL